MTDTHRDDLDRLTRSAALAPLWPLVWTVWADGDLDAAEIAALCGSAGWLEAEDRRALDAWLDPDAPPSPARLAGLRNRVRERAAAIPNASELTLAGLGVELMRGGASDISGAEVETTLAELEGRLGFAGPDPTRELLAEPPDDATRPAPVMLPAFDLEALQSFLDGPYARQRSRVRDLLARPEFTHRYDMDIASRRELVLDWLRILADEGLGVLAFPGVTSERDAGHFMVAFETLAAFDASLMTKFGVQFGLFGGSVYHLGSDDQRLDLLPRIASLELPGCFAMSELGHGSNVRDIETEARWISAEGEIEVHTPHDRARKDWIGNAALHGRMATVFAQLEVGGEHHGVHAILVPLRDPDGTVLPGVRIEDCGPKMGLNGVDNGRIWFDRVRVPRSSLLSRFGRIDADGTYSSPIPSPGRRFFTMLGTLVGGRVGVAAGAVAIARVALVHAIRYGARRRQFGPPGRRETPLLEYPTHQLRLLPPLASAYAFGFATGALTELLVHGGEAPDPEVEALAAGVKALATRNTTRTVQVCREACGGQGYLSVNRLGELKADSDVFTTYEGDNVVLLQLVAKARLASFRARLEDSRPLGLVRHLAGQAATAVTELNPVAVRQRSPEHLRDPDFQGAAFRYRESRLVTSLARRLKRRIDDGADPFDALVACQDHALAAARAYTMRWVLERFTEAVERCPRDDLRRWLTRLRDLFALDEIHRDSGWFQQAGYLEDAKARAIRDQVAALCAELRDQAVPLVDAFSIPDSCLGPIGRGELSG